MSGLTVIYVFFVLLFLAVIGVTLVPKQYPNSLLIKTSIALSVATTYLMWAIAYLAQLNPLIYPTPAEAE
ncbi:hypothetical protein MP638_005144 [Amoeboaphelidium occidentale]|nr:hypothetical protein MP638_005144 [Amoeboaphelidium occidentale]